VEQQSIQRGRCRRDSKEDILRVDVAAIEGSSIPDAAAPAGQQASWERRKKSKDDGRKILGRTEQQGSVALLTTVLWCS